MQIRETWSRAEVTTFLAIAASERLCVVWRLSLHGLRRGEAPNLLHKARIPFGTKHRPLDARQDSIGGRATGKARPTR